MILPSAPFVEKNRRAIAKKVRGMQTPPTLAVVLVGNDPASLSYVRQKERMATTLGCGFFLLHLPDDPAFKHKEFQDRCEGNSNPEKKE